MERIAMKFGSCKKDILTVVVAFILLFTVALIYVLSLGFDFTNPSDVWCLVGLLFAYFIFLFVQFR